MKKFIYLSLIMVLALACRKEDEDKSDYYNPDGSLLTWEQASFPRTFFLHLQD